MHKFKVGDTVLVDRPPNRTGEVIDVNINVIRAVVYSVKTNIGIGVYLEDSLILIKEAPEPVETNILINWMENL